MRDKDLGSPRPHALYVAWGFPPQTGGGVYRTLATANTLVAAGFDVTVLTAVRDAYPEFTGADATLEPLIDPRVEVVRLPFTRPLYDVDLRRWTRERAEDPAGWDAHYREHERDVFPEAHFGPWHDTVVGAAEDVHRRRPVDLVIGSANPHVDLAPGHRLHELFGVPYVIDHRDAWRLDVYDGTEVGTDDPRIAALETAYMESAQEIWFVNQPILRWHQELYPQAADRMRVVENGFDPAFAPAPTLTPPPADRPLTFTYIGTIGDRVPVPEAVEGWVAARDLSPDVAAASADIWGPLSASDGDKRRLLAGAAAYGVHYRGPAQKADVAGVYAASDVLLLILSRGRYVTSGKVYEYMASALPIVSVHEPGNGAADVLAGYPLWFQAADLTPTSVARAIADGAEAARTASPEVRGRCVEYAARYERDRQLRAPVEELYASVAARQVADR